jgi:hypothetical protein
MILLIFWENRKALEKKSLLRKIKVTWHAKQTLIYLSVLHYISRRQVNILDLVVSMKLLRHGAIIMPCPR